MTELAFADFRKLTPFQPEAVKTGRDFVTTVCQALVVVTCLEHLTI